VKLSEVILLVLDEAGGSLHGRTRMQKVLYFLCRRIGVDAEYSPHYYGPYSEQVAGAVDSLVARGLVEEVVEPTSTGGPFEGKIYEYELDSRARELLASIEELQGNEARRVREHYRALLSGSPSTQALAVASKLDIILAGTESTSTQLQEEAKKYGWPMSQSQVQDGIEFLLDKGFADPA
jgi:hypothetical protein